MERLPTYGQKLLVVVRLALYVLTILILQLNESAVMEDSGVNLINKAVQCMQ